MEHRVALVRLGIKRLPPYALLEKGRVLLARLTGNPAFPHAQALMADLSLMCDELDVACQRATSNGGRLDIQERNAAYAHLTQLIRRLGGFIQADCGGQSELIQSVGLDVKRGRQPSQPVNAPGNVTAVRGNSPGTIAVRWSAVKNRRLYIVFIQVGAHGHADEWVEVATTSKNTITIGDLASDRIHTFRVLAVGTVGRGPVRGSASVKAP